MKYPIIFYVCFIICRLDAKNNEHRGQKKQFVNFGNNAGGPFDSSPFSRGFGDFGGGENNGGGGDGGYEGMQLSENNMGGLNLQGNGMDNGLSSLNSFLAGGGNSFGSLGGSDGISQLVDGNDGGGGGNDGYGGNEGDSYQGDQGMSMGLGQESPMNRGGDSYVSSMGGSNDNDNDLLSQFTNNGGSLDNNLESNINLGDSVNSQPIGQFDMSSFEGLSNSGSIEGRPHSHHGKVHKQGDDRQGIGGGGGSDMQDLLTNELGQLDSSDEKLQKMLETGLSGDSNFVDSAGTEGGSNSPDEGLGMMNSQNELDQMDAQPSSSPDELPSMFPDASTNINQQAALQQSELNQLAGTMTQSNLGSIHPVTVHAHASDKPGSDPKDAPPPEESRQTAQQVQETASKQHKLKLIKLKRRLKLLREKLNQLEEEQAKKSTSNKNNDPKTARNDAIKKLLIKNLKLAAMIASKEIQLEEAKGRGLAYLSGKKEEETDITDTSTHDKSEQSFSKSKPLTELSKKAEEEVNHLSRNPDLDKQKPNNATSITSTITSPTTTTTTTTATLDTHKESINLSKNNSLKVEGNTTLRKINETLQDLDKNTAEVHSRSSLTNSSKRFLKRLQKQIQSMSPPQAHVVEEKALSTLYKAMKAKAAAEATKKKSIIRKQQNRTVGTKGSLTR